MKGQMEELYTQKEGDEGVQQNFLSQTMKKVDADMCDFLEMCITTSEISYAIKSFQGGKTPGSDGLPVEFYVIFGDLLVPILKRLFDVCFEEGHMSYTMHYGIISQIYKGAGDKRERANWRPLTMLNVDYKILAKTLTIRLRQVMQQLVHIDQTCAVPGRDIRDGLLALYTTVESMILNYTDGILVSLDHMSAFDMIEWDYILQSMKAFGFGPNFMKWIRTIYCSGRVRSSVQVNGFLSSPFLVTRGIRQGCPLSPLLNVLVSETVTNYIRNSPLVKGITIEGLEYKINSYADDTNLFIKDYESVKELMEIYRNYKKASGATLKISKTQMLLFGRILSYSQFQLNSGSMLRK